MKSIKARNRQEGRLLESADTIGSTMAKRPRHGLRFPDGHAGNTGANRSPDARNARAAGAQKRAHGAPRQAARERRVRTRKGFTARTPRWKKRHEEIFFVPVRLWS